jgi:hypothetical protein
MTPPTGRAQHHVPTAILARGIRFIEPPVHWINRKRLSIIQTLVGPEIPLQVVGQIQKTATIHQVDGFAGCEGDDVSQFDDDKFCLFSDMIDEIRRKLEDAGNTFYDTRDFWN